MVVVVVLLSCFRPLAGIRGFGSVWGATPMGDGFTQFPSPCGD